MIFCEEKLDELSWHIDAWKIDYQDVVDLMVIDS